jgi:AcrR family transcriptional regulator
MAKKRMTREQRRAQLISVGLRIFGTLGCSGTSTCLLAAEAGITEPILYRHFAGKLEYFAACVQHAVEQIVADDRSEYLPIVLDAALFHGHESLVRDALAPLAGTPRSPEWLGLQLQSIIARTQEKRYGRAKRIITKRGQCRVPRAA